MKKIIVLAVFLLIAIVYFTFYHQNKELKFIPKNADIVVLIDVKKLERQYISNLAIHPSKWLGNKAKNTISIQESGVQIPDFLQIFHVSNTQFSEWYSVVEIKNEQQFIKYLKQQKFIDKGKNVFQKEQIILTIDHEKCIIGTSDRALKNIRQFIASGKNDFRADSFINGSLGSISFISGPRTRNFSINLNNDDIEIKSAVNGEAFNSIIAQLQQKNTFLETELDSKNIQNLASFFDKTLADSLHLNHFTATADPEQVSDTIITYGYDDNFNEIEKKSFRKITQLNYVMALQSLNPEKTEQYFQHKKWMNAQNQFTAIPFQPNVIEKNKVGFEIKSTRKAISLSPILKENYIFIRNKALLYSSLTSLTPTEKKLISNLEYLFYGNKGYDYYVKLKFRKEDLPLILR
ncbi:hypothetical protein SAMN05443633_11438 [Chryseobacterium arachidis]|uniref:Uncharacterized protein n=1 Tax=Chryseobacterium arachidis TaxID=1416778 RepID=A0A1M5J9U1_9FLAO|nr:hypothetical protein [Chryseobacterium arachidis]SHG36783.1 hypothetical protein SAMN05443633_11438 [Chryseobacterium arachidis]